MKSLTGKAGLVPRQAVLTGLFEPGTGELLDRGLVLWFPGPASFTGEDVAEYHLHGGRSTVSAVLAVLGREPGHRHAGPGEFSRRAFLAGKLDLTEAEGVADLVAAETDAQRRQALRQMEGALGNLYEGWRERLISALSRLEAAIDFADEDLPPGLAEEAGQEIFEIRAGVAAHLADGHRGERLRDGVRVAILGAPNVGKSSLLNQLARREAAIVADSAGTTRDVIEVHLDLGGLPVTVLDTAGVRDGADMVERAGIARALAAATAADLLVVLVDARDGLVPEGVAGVAGGADVVLVANKADLCGGVTEFPGGALGISAMTGDGIAALVSALRERLAARFQSTEAPALTRARHRDALERCLAHLDRFDAGTEIALGAEDLRLAARELGRITGRVGVEDILDVVFRDFCIGK